MSRAVAMASDVVFETPLWPEAKRILTPEATAFVVDLTRRFSPQLAELLEARRLCRLGFDRGERPRFLDDTENVRSATWRIAAVPDDLRDRRVEITGPVDRKMMINALNSGASAFMADFEDANAPTFRNLIQGQLNLVDAVRRTLHFVAPETGKTYELVERPATLLVRPRGLHLPESHLLVDGKPIPGSFFDFGLYLFHNAEALRRIGSGPYLYLPKLEHHLEARLWNDIFVHTEKTLGIAPGTIKATVLIETLPAAFQMDEILYELREHSAGLNCGRWDYIFSFIKKLRADPKALTPDREQITMDKGFLLAYVKLLIKTCHRRGAHAMGGMAAQIPIKSDPIANERALDKVRADKLREVKAGHDGTWVAHPGLVPVAREVFDRYMPGPNQIERPLEEHLVTTAELLEVPQGTRTLAGLSHNIRVGIAYLEAWLRGNGCVPLYGLMEDAATAEIARTQVWQWLHHKARLETGEVVSPSLVRSLIQKETSALATAPPTAADGARMFAEASALFETFSLAAELPEFLTITAYEKLLARGN